MQPPPTRMNPAHSRLIRSEVDSQVVAQPARPDWLSMVVGCRDQYIGVGFYSESQHPVSALVYKLLLAIGQPQRVMFLECRRCGDTGCGWDPRHYQYEALKIVDHLHVPFIAKDDIMVIPQMCCRGSTVYAVGLPVSLSFFARFHRKVAPVSGGTRTSNARRGGPTDQQTLEHLQNEFPWLTLGDLSDILNKGSRGAQADSATLGQGSSSSAFGPTVENIAEDVFASAAAELQTLKEQNEEPDHEVTHSTVRVLGGQWSVKRSNQSATDIGAFSKDKTTSSWCAGVGWPASKTFALRKHGGAENSRRLSEEVCRRGNYFLKTWIDAGSVAPFSFAAIKPGYKPPPSYETWVDGLPINSEAFKAAMAVRDLCPRDIPPP